MNEQEVIDAFKRLHSAWLHRRDLDNAMDALAAALGLHRLTLKPLQEKGRSPKAPPLANDD